MKNGRIMKSLLMILSVMLLFTAISPLVLATTASEVETFRRGTTSTAYYFGNLWTIQNDDTLWYSGASRQVRDGENHHPIGSFNVYDYAETSGSWTTYYQTNPAKVMDSVKQVHQYHDTNWNSKWIVQKDGTLWGAGFLLNEFNFDEHGNLFWNGSRDFINIMGNVDHISVDGMTALVVKKDHG